MAAAPISEAAKATLYAQYLNTVDEFPSGSAYRMHDQRLLGIGAFGSVFRAETRSDPADRVAYKIIPSVLIQGIPDSTLRELAAMKTLRHPHIVTLRRVEHIRAPADTDPYNIALALELAWGNLDTYIESNSPLSVAHVKVWGVFVDELVVSFVCNAPPPATPHPHAQTIMHQLLSAMDYCHSRSFIHRDLKPANLLISRDGKLKVADFGLALPKYMPRSEESLNVVTRYYRAPEISLGIAKYSFAIDVWSIGCIFWEIVTGETLFNAARDSDLLPTILSRLGCLNVDEWPEAKTAKYYRAAFESATVTAPLPESKFSGYPGYPVGTYELFRSMLIYNPANRITCRQALEHPFFKGIDTTGYQVLL